MKTQIRTIHFFRTLGSTNDYAKDILKLKISCEFPLLVYAQEQTAGRGRGSKKWWTGKDSLAVSLVLKLSDFSLQRENFMSFSPLIAQAVAATIRSVFEQHGLSEPEILAQITVHPPNDVYIDGKKVCGILIECPNPEYAVIGIGVNTNNTLASLPAEFQDVPITTLLDRLATKIDHTAFLTEMLQRIFRVFVI